ncbi:hypothetical protein COU80_00065 [Candidatus Peregrinibacteria bacterium CG10_big_fil_rev_8_21_14_0_10_55_24]|nr:MAG: hypothetical protein COU80_00065 [Candidatus Peregrinibacteria bacterium CG10_big_fil_rev_8_21_14_0_10_55_24]
MPYQHAGLWVKKHSVALIVGALILLLAAKFLYPVVRFGLPLGFDPGIYRYLFLRYAEAWPPFVLPELRPWAQEYPYGLFIVSSYLLKLSIPVDWFLGWIWSAMAVLLISVFGMVMAQREDRTIGVLTLLMGLLSLAYYDGFAAMYWKTFFSLVFLVLTLSAFEKKSLWIVPLGAMTILSHNQTGLILALVLAAWWVLHLPTQWRNPSFRRLTILFVLIALLGLIWYAPIWFRAFWAPLKSILLLRGEDAPGGVFPDAILYVRNGWVLLALGMGGFAWSFRRERFSVWQLSVLVCAVFVLFKLVFYRRFFLQLDFFLLPFAAMGLRDTWIYIAPRFLRVLLVALILWQGWLSVTWMLRWEPGTSVEALQSIQALPAAIESDAAVIALENQMAVRLLGWLPEHQTGGPGLFDYPPWTYDDWEQFLYGSHDERLDLLSALQERPLYFMTSPLFYEYYGEYVKAFLADPCFEHVKNAPLLRVTCMPGEGE